MTTLPKWLTEFCDENIDLLSAKRGKDAWKVAFSCGAAILVLDVPYDALGRADMVIALQTLASAIEADPPEQPDLPNVAPEKPNPKQPALPGTDPKAAQKAASKPESAKAADELIKKAQASLDLPEPAHASPPPPLELPPQNPTAPIATIDEYMARKPLGRHPKPDPIVMDLKGGDTIEVPGDAQVSRWIGPGEPPDQVDIPAMNAIALTGNVQKSYAAAVVQGAWCLWWSPESHVFIALQGNHPAGRKPKRTPPGNETPPTA
jgi:hypothetical protein